MTTIIAGQYDTFDEAGLAADRLREAGFGAQAISVFFNGAPGRHATFPIGGDEFADPEAHPLGRGVGAYVGGLAGAASESESHDAEDPHRVWRRPAGVMVAVAIDDPSRERAALDALRDTGAENIEQAEGEIRDGNWIDFDPLASPRLVDEPQRSAPAA